MELIIPDELKQKYPPRIINDFLDYWNESNGKKCRWEYEKIFDIKRRLDRWQRNKERWEWQSSQKSIKVNETPTRESYEHSLENGLD